MQLTEIIMSGPRLWRYINVVDDDDDDATIVKVSSEHIQCTPRWPIRKAWWGEKVPAKCPAALLQCSAGCTPYRTQGWKSFLSHCQVQSLLRHHHTCSNRNHNPLSRNQLHGSQLAELPSLHAAKSPFLLRHTPFRPWQRQPGHAPIEQQRAQPDTSAEHFNKSRQHCYVPCTTVLATI